MKTLNRYSLIKKTNIFNSIETLLQTDYSTNIVVPFVCSDQTDFTSKFLQASFKNFSSLETNFLANKSVLGKVDFYKVKTTPFKNSLIFASMPCHRMKAFGRKINYGELASCMHQINNAIKRSRKNSDEFNIDIHSPKFGTGISGGDWRIISELVNDIWINVKVNIYEP